jgi:hypothetical protein
MRKRTLDVTQLMEMIMKKLFYVLLTIYVCNIATIAHSISGNKEIRRKASYNLNQDLIKGSISLACTLMLSYLTFKCTVNDINKNSSSLIDQVDTWIHKNVFLNFLDFENNQLHQFISCSLPILSTIGACECGKYTLSKFKNIINQNKEMKSKEKI